MKEKTNFEFPEWINEDKHLEDYMPNYIVYYAKKEED